MEKEYLIIDGVKLKYLAEIWVVENNIDNVIPIIYVPIEFALLFKVGDIIIFDEHGNPPTWVKKWEYYEQLIDRSILLTDRIFKSDCLQFYADRT